MTTPDSLQPFAAALVSGALALGLVFRRRWSFPRGCFFLGMGALAVESGVAVMTARAADAGAVARWQMLALLVKSFLPGIWLCFSITYSRGDSRGFLWKWRFVIAAAFVLPIGLGAGFHEHLIRVLAAPHPDGGWWVRLEPAARALHVLFLLATVFILMNLEQTFRSAVGTMRWRIKFAVLGLAVVFGARIYTQSQALLFSGYDDALSNLETGALLIGCALIALAYLRNGFGEIDVYPSQAVLRSSVTVILAGGYLLAVGVFAEILALRGGGAHFRTRTFVGLVGVAALAVLLLSERLRQRISRFVSLHFQRPQHDFRRVWTLLTQRVSSVMDPAVLCSGAAGLIADTFRVLSVTIWLADEQKDRFVFGASTSRGRENADADADGIGLDAVGCGMRDKARPFDLEKAGEDWAGALRQMSSTEFRNGGNRMCVPLLAADRMLGVAILADRVDGVPYTAEELELLACIGDQVAAGLLNIRLHRELVLAKELEAFQTMSTFFVHDLKNAASGLNLMLQNLPVHFDDPAFREDALRGIGTTVKRINDLIARLSLLRSNLQLNFVEADLNQLVTDAFSCLRGYPDLEVHRELRPLERVMADTEQIQNVVTNLLLNACDAMDRKGRIRVETSQQHGTAVLAVSDEGCGMSPTFLRDSLFRPFRSTKKKGLGIGMFQSKIIAGAHRGSIRVESEAGRGTTVRLILPSKSQST